MVRLLALELSYTRIQTVDLVLRALANGSLGFAVVGALSCQLFRRQGGDGARRRLARLLLLLCGQLRIARIRLPIVSVPISVVGGGGCPDHDIGVIWGNFLGYGTTRLLPAANTSHGESCCAARVTHVTSCGDPNPNSQLSCGLWAAEPRIWNSRPSDGWCAMGPKAHEGGELAYQVSLNCFFIAFLL